ncbi:MAG: heparinase II/III family protein, partial [Victivallales bacterium]|nr:heparinase II/III family protein [Victivallales bacterium]
MMTGIWLALGFIPLSGADIGRLQIPAANVPPGEHPRLFFSKDDLKALRERASSTEYAPYMTQLRKLSDSIGKLLEKNDAAEIEKLKKESLGGWSKFAPNARNLALLAILTDSPADYERAVKYFKIWLDANPLDAELKPAFSWGNGDYAIAYDLLFNAMTPEERARARHILACMVGAPTAEAIGRDWYTGGPNLSMRIGGGANWIELFTANSGLTAMAIEGEEGANPELLAKLAWMFRRFLSEGISADGALYEGMSYATGFGTHFTPQMILALKFRGIDTLSASNLAKVAEWIAQEALPWGYEAFDHNKSGGIFSAAPFATFLAKEYGGLSVWMINNFALRKEGGELDLLMCLVNGIPEKNGTGREGRPLSKWFSSRGLVFCRSGWGMRDTQFMFITNPVGMGHTHADQGSFCIASNGEYLAADSGARAYASEFHNLVLVDGVGQPQREGSVDSFIKSVDANAYSTLIDTDLRLSYARVAQGVHTGPWNWEVFNPLEEAERKALFVRGASGPVIVISDKFKKDSRDRLYEWGLHTPSDNVTSANGRRFRFAGKFGGKYLHTLDPGKISVLEKKNVPDGVYHGWLLVRSEPSPPVWANNNVIVNGVPCPYTTTFFGRGNYREGWKWLPLKPKGKTEINVTGGNLSVKLESVS